MLLEQEEGALGLLGGADGFGEGFSAFYFFLEALRPALEIVFRCRCSPILRRLFPSLLFTLSFDGLFRSTDVLRFRQEADGLLWTLGRTEELLQESEDLLELVSKLLRTAIGCEIRGSALSAKKVLDLQR